MKIINNLKVIRTQRKSHKSSLPWTPDMIRTLSATLSRANAVRPQNSCLRCPTILESRLKKYLHLINLLKQYREENKQKELFRALLALYNIKL